MLGAVWPQGDSPPVLVTASTDESSTYTQTAADAGRGLRRVCTDVRLLWATCWAACACTSATASR